MAPSSPFVPHHEQFSVSCSHFSLVFVLNACMLASVHFDKVQDENLRVFQSTDFSGIQPLSSITQNWIFSLTSKETFGLKTDD